MLASNFNHMTSELRKHRMALEDSNRQLDRKVLELSALANYNDNILASMTSGLLTLDVDGHIETFNAMAETITGLRGMDIRGQSAPQVFAANVQFLQVLETSRQHRTPLTVTTPRVLALMMANKCRWRCARPCYRIAKGKRAALLAIFEDLSPMQTLERRLHRADRLAALGQMAAGVAHEIKNPLASVRTFAQLVSRKHHDSRFVEKFDRIVPQELDRINFIVEELLNWRGQRGCTVPRLPCPLSCSAWSRLTVSVCSSRAFSSRLIGLPTLPPLLADAEQLHR